MAAYWDDVFQIKFAHFSSRFVNEYNGKDNSVEVTRITGGPAKFEAFADKAHLNEDNDVAPRAYGRDNPTNLFAPGRNLQQGLQPYERYLANATSNPRGPGGFDHGGHSWHWTGVYATTIADAKNRKLIVDHRSFLRAGLPDPCDHVVDKYPVVQDTIDRGGVAPGYHVSNTTRVAHKNTLECQQQHWLDAANEPFGVWSKRWEWSGSKVTDDSAGVAIRGVTGNVSAFTFGDTRGDSHVGEMSRKVCRTLVPTPDGAAIPNSDLVSFLVFPGATNGAAGIRAQIPKLQQAANSDELALFFACGAHLATFKKVLRRLVAPTTEQARLAGLSRTFNRSTNPGPPPETFNILLALGQLGYNTNLTLTLSSRSINL